MAIQHFSLKLRLFYLYSITSESLLPLYLLNYVIYSIFHTIFVNIPNEYKLPLTVLSDHSYYYNLVSYQVWNMPRRRNYLWENLQKMLEKYENIIGHMWILFQDDLGFSRYTMPLYIITVKFQKKIVTRNKPL